MNFSHFTCTIYGGEGGIFLSFSFGLPDQELKIASPIPKVKHQPAASLGKERQVLQIGAKISQRHFTVGIKR